MYLPNERGCVTEALVSALRQPPAPSIAAAADLVDGCIDEDLQLALWICYELHYRGFEDAASGWEWAPELLTLRAALEHRFLAELAASVPAPHLSDQPIADQLAELVRADYGPSLSRYLQSRATRAQFEEFVAHRSVYHLKEADPHSWAIPRLAGRTKAALIEIQSDEYGNGAVSRMHSELFRVTMRELGLDDTYGRYVDWAPATTLAITNLISFFGLHRERRGALVGHLAAFEMTSSLPNRRYSRGLRRVRGSELARRFYDEHITADALHEQLAAHDLCGSLVADEPELADDVLFGAACALHLDNVFAASLLDSWAAGRTSLYGPVRPEALVS